MYKIPRIVLEWLPLVRFNIQIIFLKCSIITLYLVQAYWELHKVCCELFFSPSPYSLPPSSSSPFASPSPAPFSFFHLLLPPPAPPCPFLLFFLSRREGGWWWRNVCKFVLLFFFLFSRAGFFFPDLISVLLVWIEMKQHIIRDHTMNHWFSLWVSTLKESHKIKVQTQVWIGFMEVQVLGNLQKFNLFCYFWMLPVKSTP